MLELIDPAVKGLEMNLELLDLLLALFDHAGHLGYQGLHLIGNGTAEPVEGVLLLLQCREPFFDAFVDVRDLVCDILGAVLGIAGQPV